MIKHAGRDLHPTAIERSKARLLQSGLFESVDVSTEDGQAPQSLDVTFSLSERAPSPKALAAAPAPSAAGSGQAPKKAPTALLAEPPDPSACHVIPIIGARHILVAFARARKAPAGATRTREDAQRRARQALWMIRDGASFTSVVDAYTDEPGGRERGGDLGEFERETMVDAFSDAAFRLEVGEVSEVVETEYGLHIIQRTK